MKKRIQQFIKKIGVAVFATFMGLGVTLSVAPFSKQTKKNQDAGVISTPSIQSIVANLNIERTKTKSIFRLKGKKTLIPFKKLLQQPVTTFMGPLPLIVRPRAHRSKKPIALKFKTISPLKQVKNKSTSRPTSRPVR